MASIYFPAIIERGKGVFGVSFPDLAGCTSWGKTAQDAARNADQALDGHLLTMAEHDEEIPQPSEMDNVERDPEVDEVARILVRTETARR